MFNCLNRSRYRRSQALEYVTIEPSDSLADFAPGALPRRKDGGGLCQWEYGIVAKRKAMTGVELLGWCEKEVKMLLGGVMAEKRYYGPDATPFHADAWSSDEEMVERRIEHLITQSGADAGAELQRFVQWVGSALAENATWEGVLRIAQALVTRGAIPGREVPLLFEG
jgi:hypothetical protein